VADFIGETNFIAGTLLSASQGRARVSTAVGDFDGVLGDPGPPPAAGAAVTVSVRPECWTISGERPAHNAVRGRIGKSTYLGENAQYDFVSGGATLKILELNPRFVDRSDAEEFFAGVRPEDVVVLAG
jgi:iron(III) transport system ATP-binding protein